MTAPAALRFEPTLERAEPDEERTAAGLSDSMRGIQETTFRDYGHAVRSVHAKSHALLQGELRVLDDLPAALAQGLFAKAAIHPVLLRLSTNPGDVLDDSVSTPRGLAIKVLGVDGERLPGSEGDRTQDFVMVNAPAFAAPDAASFAKNLKLLAATTDTGQVWKKAFSTALRGIETVLEAAGTQSGMVKTLGGHPLTHPLGETFYTQTPFLYGDHVAKFSIAPVAPALTALTDAPLDIRGSPNGLREAVIDFFSNKGGEWELRVQLRSNAQTMPVEDASVVWPETESPYVAVARITVPPQPAWSEARALQVDDGLSFSPWHGLAAHRPLGSINRARRNAYREAAEFRAERNRCPIHEPGGKLALAREPAASVGTSGREGRRGEERARGAVDHARAGAAGGLFAGLLLSILLAWPNMKRKPSELVGLQRRSAAKAGFPSWRGQARPTLGEELSAHGGHLALSAIAGAAYSLVKREDRAPVASGLAFGVGFYALAYGVVAPALGLWPSPWRDKRASVAQHLVMHGLFGVVTAFATNRLRARI